ncbi:MAG TPA: SDR family NAD(P)-dependent oxidoreductase [Candidatus Binatia bacterium]|nr:SDR family NAD(P)-dependent oxidoreductase [Candidatus Binatia bacterium]
MGLLEGKVAIVTGAGRGLGRAEALALARHGAAVVVNDLGTSLAGEGADAAPGAEVVAAIRAAGGSASLSTEDVADWQGAERLVEQAYALHGGLDVLVNNAGVLRDRMSFNMSEEEYDVVMRVHCKGHFAPTRHACARWRARAKREGSVYGRVINTTSEAGLIGSAGNSNYAMAKAAIAALTVSIAREMGKYGVRANFLAPRARTRMTESMANRAVFHAPPSGFDQFDPAWPAELVVFLASAAADDVNGQGFVVWGGQVCLLHGWRIAGQITKPDGAITAEELARRKDELFAGREREPGYL